MSQGKITGILMTRVLALHCLETLIRRRAKDLRKEEPFSYDLEEEDPKSTKERIDRSNRRHVMRRERKEELGIREFCFSCQIPS